MCQDSNFAFAVAENGGHVGWTSSVTATAFTPTKDFENFLGRGRNHWASADCFGLVTLPLDIISCGEYSRIWMTKVHNVTFWMLFGWCPHTSRGIKPAPSCNLHSLCCCLHCQRSHSVWIRTSQRRESFIQHPQPGLDLPLHFKLRPTSY